MATAAMEPPSLKYLVTGGKVPAKLQPWSQGDHTSGCSGRELGGPLGKGSGRCWRRQCWLLLIEKPLEDKPAKAQEGKVLLITETWGLEINLGFK